MKKAHYFVTHCTLTGTCAAHNGHPFASLELQVHVGENIRALRIISNGDISELNIARPRPAFGDHMRWVVCVLALLGVCLVALLFWFQFDVLLDSVKLYYSR